MTSESERDGLGIFDDVHEVDAKPFVIGAAGSLVTLVTLGVLFVLAVVFVGINVLAPWIGRFLAISGSYCSQC